MNILLTGGAGYIGTHIYLCLLDAGHEPIIYDDFSTSKAIILDRLKKITGKSAQFERGDVRNGPQLESILRRYSIDLVIHLAGCKSISESILNPIHYYDAFQKIQ